MAALFGGIGVLLIPETSASKILQTRAKNLRYETKNWALHSKADETRVDAKSLLSVYLLRPFVMVVQEPILALLTAYMSSIYGILYHLFEAVYMARPFSFEALTYVM
jgi:DHA1 family multidrug resistance protein-like MFS transporter